MNPTYSTLSEALTGYDYEKICYCFCNDSYGIYYAKNLNKLMYLLIQKNLPNRFDLVREYVAENPNEIFDTDSNGNSCLNLVCCMYQPKDYDIVEFLLEVGANPNRVENDCHSLLLLSSYSDPKIVKLLIKYGADFRFRNRYGTSTLMMACELSKNDNNIETIKLLLDLGVNVNQQNNRMFTPLMSCIHEQYSNINTVKLLLEYGANINMTNQPNVTALTLAARTNYNDKNFPLMQLLLDNTSHIDEKIVCDLLADNVPFDINDRNNFETIKYLFREYSHFYSVGLITEIVKLLVKYSTIPVFDIINFFSNYDLDIYASSNLLLRAAVSNYNADPDAVTYFINCGADVNIINKNRQPILLKAIKYHKPAIVAILLEHGANPNYCDEFGNNLLLILSKIYCVPFERTSQTEIARLLIKYGLDINGINHKGKNALMYAVNSSRNTMLITYLIKNGININYCDVSGNNALMLFLARSFKYATDTLIEIINLMLDHGIDLHQSNKQNQTALSLIPSNLKDNVELMAKLNATI